MKIIPNRNMFLDNRRVERGQVEDVSKAAGDLALRHGWATLPAEKSAGKGKAPAEKAEEGGE
jgi:hypothetical protein